MKSLVTGGATLLALIGLAAQQPALTDNVKAFVRVSAPVVALTNVRVIDGTGARRGAARR